MAVDSTGIEIVSSSEYLHFRVRDDRPIARREEISKRINHAGTIRGVHFKQMIQSDESAELIPTAVNETRRFKVRAKRFCGDHWV